MPLQLINVHAHQESILPTFLQKSKAVWPHHQQIVPQQEHPMLFKVVSHEQWCRDPSQLVQITLQKHESSMCGIKKA